jgi:hypothetical protein
MATIETEFGALGTSQALTTKGRTTLNRALLIALTTQEHLPPVVLTGKLAQGPSVVREAEHERSNLVLLTAGEHVQLWDSVSVRLSTSSGGLGNARGAAQSLSAPLVRSSLGSARALSMLTPVSLRYLYSARSRSSVTEPFQQLTVGRASDNSGLAKDFLKSCIRDMLSAAEHEELEIGVESVFSHQIISLLAEHGANATEALGEVLRDKLASDAVMGVLLRQLGRIQQKSSHQVRLKLLSDILRARSVQVRHAAATGLAELDDPNAIPALELACQRERHERPREHFALVLEQLRETRNGGSVPNR